ncbi:MAG: hypothetical protein WDM85_18285 [Caulobacteraceae bacterium]
MTSPSTPRRRRGPDPAPRVTEMITGCWSTQVIHVAARLGLPDRLAAGPMTSAELARATGSHRAPCSG